MSPISSLNTEENYDTLDEIPDDANQITDEDEDNILRETNLNADNNRLCKAEAANYAVLGKTDASLAKKDIDTYGC